MRKVPPRPAIFRHSSHAEWGYGIVVADNPEKIYLSFEDGGRRVFAKAPKFRHLLVRVELPPEDADALVAKVGSSGKSAEGKKKARKPAAADRAAKSRARRSASKAPSSPEPVATAVHEG